MYRLVMLLFSLSQVSLEYDIFASATVRFVDTQRVHIKFLPFFTKSCTVMIIKQRDRNDAIAFSVHCFCWLTDTVCTIFAHCCEARFVPLPLYIHSGFSWLFPLYCSPANFSFCIRLQSWNTYWCVLLSGLMILIIESKIIERPAKW